MTEPLKNPSGPRIALVMGLQNEERFLAAHLAYHRMIGVERFYLFFDRSTDCSVEIASRFPGTRINCFTEAQHGESNVTEFHRLAMDQAVVWAREEGFEWLLVIDPDEFAFAENDPTDPDDEQLSVLLAAADLRHLVTAVGPGVVQIRLRTREVLPCREAGGGEFCGQIYFHEATAPVERSIHDPITGTTHPWPHFLGHDQGKSLVRTSAPVQGYDSHRWTTDQSFSRPARPQFVPLPTVEGGWHGHYFITGPEHWKNKYRQFYREPAVWPCGKPVELSIQTWKRFYAHRPSHAEIESYVREHVMLGEEQLRDSSARGRAVRDTRLQLLIEEALRRHPLSPVPLTSPADGDLTVFKRPHFPLRGPELFELSPAALPEEELRGFHAVEYLDGELVRWSKGHSSIRADLPAGHYVLEARLYASVHPAAMRTLTLAIAGCELRIRRAWGKRGRFRCAFTISPRDDGNNRVKLRSEILPKDEADPRERSLLWVDLRVWRVSRLRLWAGIWWSTSRRGPKIHAATECGKPAG